MRVSLDQLNYDHAADSPGDGADVVALMTALERLEALDRRKAEVVKLRVMWGLTIPEVAESLGVGPATVDRDWAFAKAWLKKELEA